MSGVNIEYKGSSIATIPDTGSKTIKTQGKYCEGDILVEYEAPQGGIPVDEESQIPLYFGVSANGFVLSSNPADETSVAFGIDANGHPYVKGGNTT